MRKKVLYITTLLPYLPDMGGKIKTLSTLKQLVKSHDVYLFAFADKKEDLIYEKQLLKIGIKQITTVVHPIIAEKHRLTQIIILLKSLFTPKPYSVFKYYSQEMVDKINKFLSEKRVDIFWVDHTIQTQYLPEDTPSRSLRLPTPGRWPVYRQRSRRGLLPGEYRRFKTILETHNFKTDLFRDMFIAENKIFWKLFSFYEWLKFRFYEPRELKKFDLVYAISEKEEKKIRRFNKNTKVLFPYIKPTGNQGKFATKKLFFVGLLTWYPNKQGISWFIREVFPELKKEIPEVTLDVVGDYSSRWKKPEYKGVRFHGYVKDISKFWRQASIFIVPLLYGSGIRIKILEALANRIPVVSTREGADGLPNSVKGRIFIANNKKELITKTKQLLKNKNVYDR